MALLTTRNLQQPTGNLQRATSKTFISRKGLWQGIKSAMLKPHVSLDRTLMIGKISGEVIEFC
jgi:arginine exporter protein ArgO